MTLTKTQTLNIDLSLPDRGPELGLESIHKARGPDPARRPKRGIVDEIYSSILTVPEKRPQQITFATCALV